jgi:hypothetical protein
MKFSAHPERKTAFERLVLEIDLIHGKCHPWRRYGTEAGDAARVYSTVRQKEDISKVVESGHF